MTRSRAEITYGAIIGAVVGIAYFVGKALWAGNVTTALNSGLILGASVGAVAGAIAFFIRGRMG